MNDIYQQAGIIEVKSKSPDAKHTQYHLLLDQELIILNDLLSRTVADIKEALADDNLGDLTFYNNLASETGANIDFDDAIYLRLMKLIEEKDTEAVIIIENISNAALLGLTKSELKKVEKALNNFYFEDALLFLKQQG